MMVKGERETERQREGERERERETEDCYDLHHVETDIFRAFFLLFDGSFDTEPVLSQGSNWPPLWADMSTHWLLSE